MKISVIGIGQCGCNIADEFWNMNHYSRSFFGRGIEIVTEAFAINSDEADLASVRHIPRDKYHRILIGTATTFGHGAGKLNSIGSKIMQENFPFIVDSVLSSEKQQKSDCTLVIAGGAGGTGSGGIGWLIKGLKERTEKPVYALIALPFAQEEKGENSYAVTNTIACLKSVVEHADAMFLLDNERFARAGIDLATNLNVINQSMVKNFFDLLRAGEEKKSKYVGSKVIDTRDIVETLEDICTIGRSEITVSTLFPFKKYNYREAGKDGAWAAKALQLALTNLSLRADVKDAGKILVVLSGPQDACTLSVLGDLTDLLQEKSPDSKIRIGYYPRNEKDLSVTVVLSRLTSIPRVEDLIKRMKQLLVEKETEINTRNSG